MRVPRLLALVSGPLILLLLLAAGGAVQVVASRTPFFTGRQLLETTCPTQSSCTCSSLCPYGCTSVADKGAAKPVCTNLFDDDDGVPVLPIRNVDINTTDQDLCMGWQNSDALRLAPMFNTVSILSGWTL